MSQIKKSNKLDNVCYDIRGSVLKEAKCLEEEGHKVLKLNIGNPAPFGFEAPDEILIDIIRNLHTAQGYCDSKGLYSARKAIMQHYQARGICDLTIEDIYIGNGVSELILQSMQALLNTGDEMLIPAPDYPLWTAAVSLSGGKAVHYRCDEAAYWFPDIEDIKRNITPRTRGIVIINPNNPTGAVYSEAILKESLPSPENII
ncbi:Aspartate/tyrosine/aromatic aminotransferase [Candidatus Regiella insecticola 5.15]|uniref:alanine transaminase n=1 Tax=Candidatus Regiella insecticola 5.15 TaxID=1005043 RepID=G2GYL5_9ENTR|nr:Aspartate/tyrosine/aromatic aminotransferase [Candidatus Regiella insecticola 5.15]